MNENRSYPIVGIGASAGGIEALQAFFSSISGRPGLAFVVVTHLSPHRESLLDEVLARFTSLPVRLVLEDVEPAEDTVYVMAPNTFLLMQNGKLTVQEQGNHVRERKPVDIFLSSLAHDQGDRSVGVILSGGDGDGTLGIKAIKANGGITLAQSAGADGPKHTEMPESAIATGLVDFALPANEMGTTLMDFAKAARYQDSEASTGHGDTELSHDMDQARTTIYALLKNQVGHDFSGYKKKTFVRRVQRRMQLVNAPTVSAYVDRLRHDAKEVAALFRDLLINVTSFFRDPEAFNTLGEAVLPKLFEGRGTDDTIRVWVPGCATGEEVYSLGIQIRETQQKLNIASRVQIFATDIDERALEVARTARYPEALLEGVSQERPERYFIQDGAAYAVAKEVRDLCIFSPHSVFRDPPFSRIDLISCRNLLIYFGAEIQKQVIPIFHYALRPQGYLFLGTSENVTQFDDLFVPVDKRQRIFQRKPGPSVRMWLPSAAFGDHGVSARDKPAGPGFPHGSGMRQMAEAQVLERFAPPHVVVNGSGDVVYFSARTGKYLEAAPGTPSRQLVAMARKGLRLDLHTALREATETGHSVTKDSVAVEGDHGQVQMISLTVDMLGEKGGSQLYLVLFTDQGPALSRTDALLRANASHDGNALQTERELRDTRERLQSMLEEYETSLEELKSSNEELVSVNEELQSTNEELEASKEELVSLNEELHTVNAELSSKLEELGKANDDLRNLFESTAVATVFLDKEMAIRSYTPAMNEILNIRPSDCGRPITDLATRLPLRELSGAITKVVQEVVMVELRLTTEDMKEHYLVKLAPYHRDQQRIEGVVISFVNITSITLAEARQKVLISELQHRTRNLLAVVQSLAQQTLGSDRGMKTFSERLAALGRLQGLLSKAPPFQVDLKEIVKLEIDAMGPSAVDRIDATGPSIQLDAEIAQPFALALHELATNALKYGALMDGGAGRLEIAWELHSGDGIVPSAVLQWTERDVDMSGPEPKRGYGRELIEQGLVFALRARTAFSFAADGVRCRIEMPLQVRPVSSRMAKSDTGA